MRSTAVVAALCVALVAACGGDSDTGGDGVASLDASTAAPTPTTIVTDEATEAALFEFAECMRGKGIEIPDPVIGSDGFPELSGPLDLESMDLDAAAAALRECQSFLEGVSLGFEIADQTAFFDVLVEFAACMREQGVEFSDPDLSAGLGPGVFPDLDLQDPDVLAAIAACRDLLEPQQ